MLDLREEHVVGFDGFKRGVNWDGTLDGRESARSPTRISTSDSMAAASSFFVATSTPTSMAAASSMPI